MPKPKKPKTITQFCYICKEYVTTRDEKEFRDCGHSNEKVPQLSKSTL